MTYRLTDKYEWLQSHPPVSKCFFMFTITEKLKTLSKRPAVKYEQESSYITLEQAFNSNSVTPETKTKGDGLGTAVGGGNDDSDDELISFNFDDYSEMEQYEVVINHKEDYIPIRAPKITFFQPPLQGSFTDHHIFLKCETPTRSVMDRTVVPMKGMFGYLFNEKEFIKREHQIINGKINVWRIECMKAFAKIRKTGNVLQQAIACQEAFVRDKVGYIQKQLASFEYCSISILNKESVTKLLMLEKQPEHSTEVVYNFAKYDVIHVYVKPGGKYKLDLVTRFNRDIKLEFVFGKEPNDTIKDRVYSKRLKIGSNI